MGRGFFKFGNCGGYGDPCTACSGHPRRSTGPSTSPASRTTSTGSTPTAAAAAAPAAARCTARATSSGRRPGTSSPATSRAPPFSYDNNTALELTTRLFFLGSQPVASWYQCTPPFGGCNAGGGYLNLLAVDDDNGSLADGTPHMTAIFEAFNAHQLACNTPAPVEQRVRGRPGHGPRRDRHPDRPGREPELAVGAERRQLRRLPDRRRARLRLRQGEGRRDHRARRFIDQGLQNGFTYYYTVLPVGSNSSCFGRASACDSVVPAAGANVSALEDPPVQVHGRRRRHLPRQLRDRTRHHHRREQRRGPAHERAASPA